MREKLDMLGKVASTDIKGVGRVIYNKAETIKIPWHAARGYNALNQVERDLLIRKNLERQVFDPYAYQGFVPNFAYQSGDTLYMDKAKFKLLETMLI